MKKAILAILMLLVCVIANAYSFKEDGIYYKILSHTANSYTCEVTYYSITNNNYADKVVIPAEVTSNATTYKVVGIGDLAFCRSKNLVSVRIPKSVVRIGAYAFDMCPKLMSIDVDPSNPDYSSRNGILLNRICTRLIKCPEGKAGTLSIPDNVQEIGTCAFASCKNLTSINMTGRVTAVGDSAFWGCRGVSSIQLSRTITTIGTNAFGNCSSISKIRLPQSLTHLGDKAFEGCRSLASFEIFSNSSFSVENDVLYNASKTEIIKVPQAKAGSLAIAEGVETIKYNALSGCSQLTKIIIPATLSNISSEALSNCTSLDEINVAKGNASYTSIDGVLFDKDKTKLLLCPSGRTNKFKIPDGVVEIAASAFKNCRKLTAVTMPSSLQVVGNWAFELCSSMSVMQIPDNVTTIGLGAFRGCSYLNSINIPAHVVSIGEDAFDGCKFMTSINVSPRNEKYTSADGVLFTKDMTQLIRCPLGKSRKYEIPMGVTTLSRGAFAGCKSLTAVVIPYGVTKINGWTFTGCESITSITIPKSVSEIDDRAFIDCM